MLKFTLLQSIPAYLVASVVALLIFVFYLIGHRIRLRAIEKDPDKAKIDLGSINGTLLGLLGLLLAFTFSMSNSRYDTRRQLIIEEANDIGTVILRTDMYPDSIRKVLRANLKEYVQERVKYFEAGMNLDEISKHYINADNISKKVWSIVASYAKVNGEATRTSQIIPALNDMIDITTTRRAAGEATIPDSIMYFLFALCFGSSFLLGYDHKDKTDWIIVTGFAIMLSSTVFNIMDLDRPRSGLIDLYLPNQKIIELLDMFEE